MREPTSSVIGRVYTAWAAEHAGEGLPEQASDEHALLAFARPDADEDLLRRTEVALRVAGYGRRGKPLSRISHQEAKAFANAFLAAEGGPRTVAGAASRCEPVWLVTEVDPERPSEMLLGRALAVFDDGAVYTIGSQPPAEEVRDLLDRLDPTRPHHLPIKVGP